MVFAYSDVAQWRSGAVAQWRSGAVAQWRSGAVAQWRSGAVAQWRSGAVAQWRSGAVAQWRSGAVAQWRSGAVAQWLERRTFSRENAGWNYLLTCQTLDNIVSSMLLQFIQLYERRVPDNRQWWIVVFEQYYPIY